MVRGPKPKPTKLKELEGNPGKRRLNKREPKPKGDLIKPPPDLPRQAVPFWRQAIASCPPGQLKLLDERAVFCWAMAAWAYADAAAKVAEVGTVVKAKSDGAPAQQNPFLAVMNKQSQLMRAWASELGFTPSSRTRVNAGDEPPGGGGGRGGGRGGGQRDDFDDF